MARFNSVAEAIGDTPLVRLGRLSPAGSEVYAKLEGKNPGGSVKDRAVLSMVNHAEAAGRLRAGGTIVEPTSGNTGIAIAMMSAVRGYRAILVMPDTMSEERQAYMRAYGAELVLTPGGQGMQGALDRTAELLETIPGAVSLGQFDNPANVAAHRATTGPEILRDLPDVDFVVAGFGTGGTISGIALALRDAGSKAVAVAVEPAESPLVTQGRAGPHKIQGIGAGFVPRNLDRGAVGRVVAVRGEDAIEMAGRLAREEGIFAGISSGGNVCGAVELAKAHPGAKVVAILPDGGDKYVSTGIFGRGRTEECYNADQGA